MATANGHGRYGSLLFLWSPQGWSLKEIPGDPPRPGAELEDSGRILVVTKVGPSPLPGDPRPCAFTIGR